MAIPLPDSPMEDVSMKNKFTIRKPVNVNSSKKGICFICKSFVKENKSGYTCKRCGANVYRQYLLK